jgi:hypothetical protein
LNCWNFYNCKKGTLNLNWHPIELKKLVLLHKTFSKFLSPKLDQYLLWQLATTHKKLWCNHVVSILQLF